MKRQKQSKTVRLSPETHKRLKLIAVRNEATIDETIRLALKKSGDVHKSKSE